MEWAKCFRFIRKANYRHSSQMFKISNVLLRLKTRARQVRFVLKIEAKFSTFGPPSKLMGGVGTVSE